MKRISVVLLSIFLLAAVTKTAMAASYADIVFVVDQSGSMGGEFNWIGNSLTGIDTAMQNAGITANYGIAGYVYNAGSADGRNAWVDLPSTVASVVAEINSVSLYGATERGYHAADWSANNFSWSGSNYAKVMILITDEPNDQRSNYGYDGLTGETALAKMVADNNILLNVITYQNYYQYWDDAVYSNGSYQGIFDIDYLRTDPEGFTADFTAAKINEIVIVNPNPVPEPGTMALLGLGLIGLVGFRKKLQK